MSHLLVGAALFLLCAWVAWVANVWFDLREGAREGERRFQQTIAAERRDLNHE